MTRLQQAQTECANYQRGGTCLGIDYGLSGKPIRMMSAGKKCVIHLGEDCPYLAEICPAMGANPPDRARMLLRHQDASGAGGSYADMVYPVKEE